MTDQTTTPLVTSTFVHLRAGLNLAHRIETGLTQWSEYSAVVSIEATSDESDLLLIAADPVVMRILAARIVLAADHLDQANQARAGEA